MLRCRRWKGGRQTSGESSRVGPKAESRAGIRCSTTAPTSERASRRYARAGARVLILRNLVSDAVATQEALEELASPDDAMLLRVAGVAAPHHSRYGPEDRRLLDEQVEARLASPPPPQPLIVPRACTRGRARAAPRRW